jgi:hypothetical protein
VGTVASAMGPGTSAGQGPFSTSRGGGATSEAADDPDESGAATAAAAVLAPWERFVLGLDKALEELERENPGGITAPSQPSDRPGPAPGSGVPVQGGGSGLRSVPERPSDDEWQGADRSQAPQPGSTPTAAIDAALRRLGTDRAGSDPVEIDRPGRRRGREEPGLTPACLALSLLASRWVRLPGSGPHLTGVASTRVQPAGAGPRTPPDPPFVRGGRTRRGPHR